LLAAHLPDEPRWVETRSLLLSGECTVQIGATGAAAVVLEPDRSSGALVGAIDPHLLVTALANAPVGCELLVQLDALEQARHALPEWRLSPIVVVHRLASPYGEGGSPAPGVRAAAPPEAGWFVGLPEDFQYGAEAAAAAMQFVDGSPVAMCAASDVTETLWDVGIDTLPEHRRRGYAVACFHALAAMMAGQGRQPVWCAYADYPPSLTLAAKLGFEPVDRLAVLIRS
jgi:GNAT superfamily N-acetyltransferase